MQTFKEYPIDFADLRFNARCREENCNERVDFGVEFASAPSVCRLGHSIDRKVVDLQTALRKFQVWARDAKVIVRIESFLVTISSISSQGPTRPNDDA